MKPRDGRPGLLFLPRRLYPSWASFVHLRTYRPIALSPQTNVLRFPSSLN
nr:MAG TPA: hypothetical protein [Caudoviricetes sp.]